MKTYGFSLFDVLLIAVVIGILFLIAMPNLSFADVELKAQQAQHDLKMIGHALEAYYLDHNTYPPDGYSGIPEGSGWHYLNYMLTTPVAYLPHLDHEDPFFDYDSVDEGMLEAYPWMPGYRYINYEFIYNEILENSLAYERYYNVYGSWALVSRGPEGIYSLGNNPLQDDQGTLWLTSAPYDPTNGTYSRGDIVYTYNNYREDFPAADFTATPMYGAAPLEVSFSCMSEGLISEWFWDFGGGFTSNIQNPVHTFTDEGIHTVSLQVTGTGGTDTRERSISTIVPNTEYDAVIDSYQVPSLYQGLHDVIILTVRNMGSNTWYMDQEFYLGAVNNEDPIAKYLRIGLLEDVFPAQLYTFIIEVLPLQEGTFLTEWSMVKEGDLWFGETFSIEVIVTAPTDVQNTIWGLYD